MENVKAVTHVTYFGAYYKNPRNQIATIVTEPEHFARVLSADIEFSSQTALERWQSERRGVAIGKDLSEEYGWSVGDVLPLYSTNHRRANGSSNWTFKISAIYKTLDADEKSNTVLVRYDYFDDARQRNQGMVGWYSLTISDPDRAEETATKIDERFSNSSYETKTSTEQAHMEAFLEQIGDFGFMITATLGAVFFTLLLITTNTMAQSVRERTSEIGVLKALGFKDGYIFWHVLLESVVVSTLGALVGIVLTEVLIGQVIQLVPKGLLAELRLEWMDYGKAIGVGVLMGVVAGTVPAIRAMRIEIVSALGRSV